MSDNPETADREDALRQAGAALARADAARADALKQVTAALRAGVEHVSVSRMAHLAGVSRVTVYRLLEG